MGYQVLQRGILIILMAKGASTSGTGIPKTDFLSGNLPSTSSPTGAMGANPFTSILDPGSAVREGDMPLKLGMASPGISTPATGSETFGISPSPEVKVAAPKEKVPGNDNGYGEVNFDPEGSGYDYATAKKYGMSPGSDKHWGSRVELDAESIKKAGVPAGSGIMLKGAKHDTWDKALSGEEEAGFDVIKGNDGRYYSTPKTQPPQSAPNKSVTYKKAVITGYHPGEDGGTIAYTSKTGERPVRTGITAATNKKDIPAGSVIEIVDVNGKSHYRFSDDTLGSAQYTAATKRGLSNTPVIDLAVRDANEASNLTKLFGNKATQYRIITDQNEIGGLKKQGLI